MKRYHCPWCGKHDCDLTNDIIRGENDLHYYLFRCIICQMEFLVEEKMGQDTGQITRPTIIEECGLMMNEAMLRRKEKQMEQSYVIKAVREEIVTIQTMLLAAGYIWVDGSDRYGKINKEEIYFQIYTHDKDFAWTEELTITTSGLPRITLTGLANIITGTAPAIIPGYKIGEYSVEFTENGEHITVGCEPVSFTDVKYVYEKMKDLRSR